MGTFYAVSADNRDLNYDKYFKEGDTKRALIDEFNSNLEETKEKIASLTYIQNELNGIPNLVSSKPDTHSGKVPVKINI